MQLQMTSAGSIVALSGTKASVDHGRVRRRDYQTLKVLGTGSKATVKLAVRVSDGRQVALKSIRKPGVATKNGAGVGPAVGGVEAGHGAGAQTDNLPPSPDPPVDGGDGNNNAPAGGDFAAAEREWRTEVRALEMVGNHENMPALVEAFETGSKWYIAMDYQRGGVSCLGSAGPADARIGLLLTSFAPYPVLVVLSIPLRPLYLPYPRLYSRHRRTYSADLLSWDNSRNCTRAPSLQLLSMLCTFFTATGLHIGT